MKNLSHALIAVVTIVHAGVASAAPRPPAQPTALETFVTQPNVVLDLAEVVGTLDSKDASVAVDAVIASDTARPGERMKGLRFQLANNSVADQVYLDEAQVAKLLEDLAGIDDGIAELKAEGGAPYRVQGTGACWMPPRPMRILCPSYRVGPDWSGLQLAAYGGPGFDFPDERPATLAALIEQAVARLQGP